MTYNSYGGPSSNAGQPPMGGGPGGPQGPQYGSGPTGPQDHNGGQSRLARVFSNSSGLPQAVRQVQLSALVSAAGYLVLGIIGLIVSSVVMSGYGSAIGFDGLGGIGAGLGIFFLIVTMGLYALVIIPLLGGQNWGRILGIVFAILGGLSGLFALFNLGAEFAWSAGLGMISTLSIIVQVGTAIWFLVFAFRSEVAAWYAPYPPVGYQPNWGPGGQPGSYGYGGQAPPPAPGQYPGSTGYGQNPQGPAGGQSNPNQGSGDQGPQQNPPQGPPPANPPQ